MTDLTDDIPTDGTPDDSPPVATDTREMPLRYSVLKMMGKSPAHARDAMLRQGDGATLSLRLGSGAHALTFEDRPVVVFPGRRAGNEWKAFEKEHANAVILNAKEYAHAKGMSDAIKSNPVARRVLFGPKMDLEKRIDWTWNGRAWRSTPDATGFRVLAELKTTQSADPARFWRDALKFHYHVQLAIYRRAIEQATGIKPRDVYLFAVESSRPYVVTPFMLSNRSLEHGDMLAKRWHEEFLQCEASGEWPGYTRDVEELDIYDIEEETQLEVEKAMANDDGRRVSVQF